MNDILLLLAFLFVKHFIVDFPLQRPYQWMNKGRYGHLGGYMKALQISLIVALWVVVLRGINELFKLNWMF